MVILPAFCGQITLHAEVFLLFRNYTLAIPPRNEAVISTWISCVLSKN